MITRYSWIGIAASDRFDEPDEYANIRRLNRLASRNRQNLAPRSMIIALRARAGTERAVVFLASEIYSVARRRLGERRVWRTAKPTSRATSTNGSYAPFRSGAGFGAGRGETGFCPAPLGPK